MPTQLKVNGIPEQASQLLDYLFTSTSASPRRHYLTSLLDALLALQNFEDCMVAGGGPRILTALRALTPIFHAAGRHNYVRQVRLALSSANPFTFVDISHSLLPGRFAVDFRIACEMRAHAEQER